MLRGMLGWAGPGDASQSEESSSHQMRGCDTDITHVGLGRDDWANETLEDVMTSLILFPNFVLETVINIIRLRNVYF